MNIMVLDIGGTYIKCALMDEHAEFLKQWKVKSMNTNLDTFLNSLDECIQPYKDEIEGIAISMPGKIDSNKGIAHTGGAFQFIIDLPLKQILEDTYNVLVTIDNDGKCAANAENWSGALKDVGSGLVYVIGTGIGGGIVLDNHVYRGKHFTASELSWTLFDKEQPISFDNIIANHVATPSLLNGYKERTGYEVDGIEFFEHINDPINTELINRLANLTAIYIYELQTILDIERVAIGGGISAQPILIQKIQEAVDTIFDTDVPMPATKPEIVRCMYGNDANLIGALKHHLETKAG